MNFDLLSQDDIDALLGNELAPDEPSAGDVELNKLLDDVSKPLPQPVQTPQNTVTVRGVTYVPISEPGTVYKIPDNMFATHCSNCGTSAFDNNTVCTWCNYAIYKKPGLY